MSMRMRVHTHTLYTVYTSHTPHTVYTSHMYNTLHIACCNLHCKSSSMDGKSDRSTDKEH